ncbi:O-antigen ligase C-terminal domain-containing protein [Paraneptunicella aestuarii]|uniref:PglL family O-oligosaccharyltransferase n=1 Tax=Paraneptunicella aestuarii TaxID=2831148 RepID=UPI001E45438C|nr:O-antigen ligase family protein [Paraneptunicella aestuarii]UAA39664.1 O-antigen ligase C-terminal domain-containing protein [Paraneptunicella aestuarii]
MEKTKVNRILKLYRLNHSVFKVFMAAIFLVAMNYINRNMGGSGIQMPYNNATWGVTAFFVAFSIIGIAWFSRIKFTKPLLYQLLSVFLLLLPLTYTSRLFLDIEMLMLSGLGAGVLFLFCLYQFSSSSLKLYLINIIFYSSLIQTVWGFVQYYIIFEPHWLFFRADWGHPYGIFQQINDFSSYLSIGSMIAIYKLFTSATREKSKIAFTFIILVANFHLTVLSGADSAQVVALVSVFLYLVFMLIRTREYRVVSLLFCGVLLATAIPREVFDVRSSQESLVVEESTQSKEEDSVGSSDVRSVEKDVKVADTPALSSSSLGTRATIYPVAIQMILDKPWFGHGLGTFPKAYLLYQGRYLQEHPGAPAEFRVQHAHNEVLQWVVELGLGSLLGFILLLFVWWRGCLNGQFNPAILFLTLPLILHSLVELPFYHSAAHFLVFLSLLFCADVSREKKLKLPKFSKFVVIPAVLWGLIQVQVFLFSTMYALDMFLKFNRSNREEVKYLLTVNNPAAFKLRFEYELFQWKIRKGMREGKISRKDLLSYIYWAYSVTQYSPMAPIYRNFVDALNLYGNQKAALQFAEEGVLMYPDDEKLREKRDKLLEYVNK